MPRPIFYFALFALLALLVAPTVQAQEAQRPNIVLFVADDLGVYDTTPYGNAVVRTPALDAFAGESMRFTQAFAASPTCSPSRAALYTGLMPFRNGLHANHAGAAPGTKALPDYLRPLGYRIALAGKVHVRPESVFDFEYVEGSQVPGPGYETGIKALRRDLNMEAVDRWLGGDKDSPFLLVVADHSPHVVWPEVAKYDPAEVDVPPQHVDTPEYRAARARYYTDVEKMDGNVGALLETLERHRLSDNTVVIFTSDQGPQWAFAKWTLYDAGIRVPLLVRWPGVVEAGKTTTAMTSLVDLVPTFVEMAGGQLSRDLDGRSLLPVLRGETDAHRDHIFATHTGDLRMNRSPARAVRTEYYKLILNLAPEIEFNTHMNKAGDHDGGREYWPSWREASFRDGHAAEVLWRYHHRPVVELYDLARDASERRNVASEPAYRGVVARMREELAAWRAQQDDAKTGPESLPEK